MKNWNNDIKLDKVKWMAIIWESRQAQQKSSQQNWAIAEFLDIQYIIWNKK